MTPDEPPPEVARALIWARCRAGKLEGSGASLERWFAAITRMRSLSVRHGLGLHDSGEPNVFTLSNRSVGRLGPVPVKVIERRPAIRDPQSIDDVGYLVSREDLPALIISLELSDDQIRDEVERVLFERGKHKLAKALPRKPGRRSFSSTIGSGRALRKWQDHHVVELVEMLAWNAAIGYGYPRHRIGSWIDTSRLGTSKGTSEAIAVAREAISALPAILAETVRGKLPR